MIMNVVSSFKQMFKTTWTWLYLRPSTSLALLLMVIVMIMYLSLPPLLQVMLPVFVGSLAILMVLGVVNPSQWSPMKRLRESWARLSKSTSNSTMLVTSEEVDSAVPKIYGDVMAFDFIKNYAITEEQVREFHLAFGHPAPTKPTIPGYELALLRKKLIQEELEEVMRAIENKDYTNLLQELCDLQYVLDGLFVVCGMDQAKEEGFMLVHQSNMSKLGADGKPVYREDGKILKGPNYKPVDPIKLKKVLYG